MRSKYLNMVYDGWKVLSAVKTKGDHKSFILGKKSGDKTLLMTLRDSQLSKVANLKATMADIVNGKNYQVSKNIREAQNSINWL